MIPRLWPMPALASANREPFNRLNWLLGRNNSLKSCCLLLLGDKHRMLKLMRREY